MSYFGLFANLAITQLLHSFTVSYQFDNYGHNVQNFFRLNKLSRTPHFIPKTKTFLIQYSKMGHLVSPHKLTSINSNLNAPAQLR